MNFNCDKELLFCLTCVARMLAILHAMCVITLVQVLGVMVIYIVFLHCFCHFFPFGIPSFVDGGMYTLPSIVGSLTSSKFCTRGCKPTNIIISYINYCGHGLVDLHLPTSTLHFPLAYNILALPRWIIGEEDFLTMQ